MKKVMKTPKSSKTILEKAVVATKVTGVTAGAFLCVASSLFAQQSDAYYTESAKRNKNKWAGEDRQIDSKLKRLEKKFGKKPKEVPRSCFAGMA